LPTATWKGFLTFGLVSVPIRLSPAARTERVSFHQLHNVCHTRIKMPTFCPTCNRMVNRNEIEKGYEYEKDQYLLFTEAELEEVESAINSLTHRGTKTPSGHPIRHGRWKSLNL
jgi:DNA end-binding protein Ku